MSERTTGIRHPHHIEGGVSNPIERQFNAHKQERRHITRYPEAYMTLLNDYPYQEDQLYWRWRAKQREIHESIGQETEEALQGPCVIGDAHDALTEENPLNTTPLPAIHQFRPRPQKKGR